MLKKAFCVCYYCRAGCTSCVEMADDSLHMSVERGARNTLFLFVTPTNLVCFTLLRNRNHRMTCREVVVFALLYACVDFYDVTVLT